MNKNLEKFKKNTVNLIELRLKQCLLSMISDLCDMTTKQSEYEEPVEISKIRLEIFRLIKELSQVIEKPVSQREQYLNELNELKDKLTDIAEPIVYYPYCLDQVMKLLSNKYRGKKIGSGYITNLPYEPILNDCGEYIDSLSEEEYAPESKAELISCLPVLMTKAAFGDYIRASFRLIYNGESSNSIKRLNYINKRLIAPFKEIDISAQFPYIADRINEMWNMDLSDKTLEELGQLLDEFHDIQDKIEDISSDYNMLYNNINYLYAIAVYSVDMQWLFEDDIELKDLYYSACRLIDSEDAEAFVETVRNLAEKRIEDMWDDVKKAHNEFKKNSKKFASADSEADSLIKTAKDIASLYFDEIYYNSLFLVEKLELSDKDEPTDESEINSAAEEIIAYIQNLGEYYTPNKLKLAKQIFLETIPCPLSDDELYKYVKNTLDSIKGRESYAIAVENIVNLLGE